MGFAHKTQLRVIGRKIDDPLGRVKAGRSYKMVENGADIDAWREPGVADAKTREPSMGIFGLDQDAPLFGARGVKARRGDDVVAELGALHELVMQYFADHPFGFLLLVFAA